MKLEELIELLMQANENKRTGCKVKIDGFTLLQEQG
jgi:hypothetical protein